MGRDPNLPVASDKPMDSQSGGGFTPLGYLISAQTQNNFIALRKFLQDPGFVKKNAYTMPGIQGNFLHQVALFAEESSAVATLTQSTKAARILLEHVQKTDPAYLQVFLSARTTSAEDAAPLHFAASNGLVGLVEMLLEFGADPMQRCSGADELLPLAYADARGPPFWLEDFRAAGSAHAEMGCCWFEEDSPVALQMQRAYEMRTFQVVELLDAAIHKTDEGAMVWRKRAAMTLGQRQKREVAHFQGLSSRYVMWEAVLEFGVRYLITREEKGVSEIPRNQMDCNLK